MAQSNGESAAAPAKAEPAKKDTFVARAASWQLTELRRAIRAGLSIDKQAQRSNLTVRAVRYYSEHDERTAEAIKEARAAEGIS